MGDDIPAAQQAELNAMYDEIDRLEAQIKAL